MEFYIGQISFFAISFAPPGWALCNGQLLPVRGNEPLFSLLRTTYGGDGITNFGVPDLRGRVPVGVNAAPSPTGINATQLGAVGGSTSVNIPAGSATVHVDKAKDGDTTAVTAQMPASQTVPAVPPFIGLNAMICTTGLYPTHP